MSYKCHFCEAMNAMQQLWNITKQILICNFNRIVMKQFSKIQFSRQNIRDTEKILSKKIVYFENVGDKIVHLKKI